jgi:hypothetical protein
MIFIEARAATVLENGNRGYRMQPKKNTLSASELSR